MINTTSIPDHAAEIETVKLRLDGVETLIKENTRVTTDNSNLLIEIKDLLELGKTFFKIMKYVGIFAKWISSIAAGVGILWALWHSKN